MFRLSLRSAYFAAAFALVLPASAQAQDAPERPWSFEAGVGVSVFFGASEQSAIGLSSDYDYEADHLEFAIAGSFDYAQAEDAAGDSYISQRGWTLSSSLDYEPEARLSPFALLNAEGSLARGIDRRLSGGLGAKVRFVDQSTKSLDLSVAALLERTEPRDVAGEPDVVDTAGRWSARLRAKRSFDQARYTTELTTFFRPAISDFSDDYTLDLTAAFTMQLNGSAALQLRLVNKYDSLAESRGARDNNDGRFFVSLITKL